MFVVKKLGLSLGVAGGAAVLLLFGGVLVNGTVSAVSSAGTAAKPDPPQARAARLVAEGRRVFRFDTFGDEAGWGGVLGLHKASEGSKLASSSRSSVLASTPSSESSLKFARPARKWSGSR